MHVLTPTIARLVADISSTPGVTEGVIRSGARLLSRSADYGCPRRLVSEFLELAFSLPAGQPQSVEASLRSIALSLAKELYALPENVSNMARAQHIMLTGIVEGTQAEENALRAIDAITVNVLVEDENEDEDDEDRLIETLVTPYGRLFLGRHFEFSPKDGNRAVSYCIIAAPFGGSSVEKGHVYERHETLETARQSLKAVLLAA